MALIKLGPEIVEITGKCGGNVYKRDASGQHIMALPRKVHRHDIHQSLTNSQAFSALSYFATIMIAAGWLFLWLLYAATHLWKNKQGILVKLTWWNWYVHFNLMRVKYFIPPLQKPPVD